MTDRYLVDKSAFEQRLRSPLAERVLERFERQRRIVMCEIVALELLYSARNLEEYERQRRGILRHPWVPVDDQVTDRSMEVQRLLAQRGQHRLPIPDLLIAATAEIHEVTLLHYDRDFDRIAEVTGQPTQWVIPAGSV